MSTHERPSLNSNPSMSAAYGEDRSGSAYAVTEIYELCGRAMLMAFFATLSIYKLTALRHLIARWDELDTAKYLDLAANLAGLAFLVLTIGTTIFRFKSIQSADGWEPRASAFMGSFLTLSLIALPPIEAGSAWRATAILIIVVGAVLSAWVLAWLGRSFSVTPQARHLVTAGPYSIVRHPLYVCEEVTVIGVMMLYFSPMAVVIVLTQWMFQLRRMHNEERVLGAAFPEYDAYAARTPKIIPQKFLTAA
jgi:protein-S-isoprenylcysteine O-methyltransferase Ste14